MKGKIPGLLFAGFLGLLVLACGILEWYRRRWQEAERVFSQDYYVHGVDDIDWSKSVAGEWPQVSDTSLRLAGISWDAETQGVAAQDIDRLRKWASQNYRSPMLATAGYICPLCGMSPKNSTSYRWDGEQWQHKCSMRSPYLGHEPISNNPPQPLPGVRERPRCAKCYKLLDGTTHYRWHGLNMCPEHYREMERREAVTRRIANNTLEHRDYGDEHEEGEHNG